MKNYEMRDLEMRRATSLQMSGIYGYKMVQIIVMIVAMQNKCGVGGSVNKRSWDDSLWVVLRTFQY